MSAGKLLTAPPRPDAAGVESTLSVSCLLATVLMATLLAPLNATMIVVALPRLAADFDAGVAGASSLVTSYLITMAVLPPVGGRLGDRWGRRSLLLIGLVLFAAASASASLAADLNTLVSSRVLQAVGASLAFPNALALLRDAVAAQRRGLSFGLIGAAMALAAAAGPGLGHILISHGGWRLIFAVNLPLVAAALSLAGLSLPRVPALSGLRRLDFPGAAMLGALLLGLASLTAGLGPDRWLPRAVLVVATAMAAGLLLRHELRHPDPILQPRLFGNRGFLAANLSMGLSNVAMYAALIGIPLLLAGPGAEGEPAMLLAALLGTAALGAPLGGHLADQLGRRAPAITGLCLLALGMSPIALHGQRLGVAAMAFGLGLAGAGLGIASSAIQTGGIEAVGVRDSGAAAGFLATSRYLGGAVGSGLVSVQLVVGSGDPMQAVFSIAAAAALVAALSGFFLAGLE